MPARALRPPRLVVVALLAALHFGTYLVVTRIIDRMPATALRSFATPVDDWIPYLSWTWPIYWAAYPFVMIAGAIVLWRLPAAEFRRAAEAFALMILGCGLLQMLLPAPAPWPDDPVPIQRLTHASSLVRRWATLPSMHVALCTLMTVIGWRVFRGGAARIGTVVITLAISIATLTLKEHVFLDAATGALAGAAAGAWWWRGLRRPAGRADDRRQGVTHDGDG